MLKRNKRKKTTKQYTCLLQQKFVEGATVVEKLVMELAISNQVDQFDR